MSTRFYYGQLDYITQLNLMDDIATASATSAAAYAAAAAQSAADAAESAGQAAAPIATVGLGITTNSPYLSNIDSTTAIAGFYYVDASTTGTFPVSAAPGMVIHKIYGTSGYQQYQPHGQNKLYYRRRTSSAWSSWLELPSTVDMAAADAATLASANSYADGLVVSMWDDRGNYDASGNTFPTTGGSGASGAVKKNDIWTISVAGTLGGTPVAVRQFIRALIDAPGQTATNWAIGLASTDIDDSITDGVIGRAPSQNAVFDALATKAAKGANSDITSLSGLTTALSAPQGGTGFASYAVGDFLFASASNALSKLTGNITTTRKFLSQTGNGSVSSAPVWNSLVAADIPDLDWVKITSGKPTTLDGYGANTGSNLLLQSTLPVVTFDETDQTGAAGKWRVVADGNMWRLDKNTATARDFSTFTSPFDAQTTGVGRVNGAVPVQQGTGTGQGSNTVKMGWGTSGGLKVTVDSTDQGFIPFVTGAPSSGSSIVFNGPRDLQIGNSTDVGLLGYSGTGAVTYMRLGGVGATGGVVHRYDRATGAYNIGNGNSGAEVNRLQLDGSGLFTMFNGLTVTGASSVFSGGPEVALNNSGHIQSGSTSSLNIALGDQIIQCRNNGAINPLYLNYFGQGVNVGGSSANNSSLTVNGSVTTTNGLVLKSTSNLKVQLNDGETVRGWLSADSTNCFGVINSSNTAYTIVVQNAGHTLPGSFDNQTDLGIASNRWRTVYAGTGSINTSDAREKTKIIDLSGAEVNAAKDLSKLIGTYKWLESIKEKGDDARTHIGLTVQQAIEVMKSHGLDPMSYAFICYDEWEEQAEVKDEEGNIKVPYRAAGNRYGFRYDQLNIFIARGLEARISALENITGV